MILSQALVSSQKYARYVPKIPQGRTPTTPVTSTSISPVKMSIGRKLLTNLRSEMIFLQGKPVFLYLPTIYIPIQDSSWAAKGKVGHVTSSAFRSFLGFIIYKY
jgi:hypothetical protein